MSISRELFGKLDSTEIYLFTLTNSQGMRARVCTFGAILIALEVPDKTGNVSDVCLGYDKLDDYVNDTAHFGGVIGRYANRIALGRFVLEGRQYKLAVNNGPNHLHGGIRGFDKVVWQVQQEQTDTNRSQLTLHYMSADGQEGYPGNLSCKVTYQLTDDNQLKIIYQATTDKPTVINLTNHSYFNLAGQGNGDILAHKLTIYTDKYTVADETLIPTGEIGSVKGTPFDFTQAHTIGERINQTDGGYDLNYVLTNNVAENSGDDIVRQSRNDNGLIKAARVEEPTTGRIMEVHTTQPGMQFYTGNFLDGIKGKANKIYNKYYALCLETQHFPDSPNKPQFPSTVLMPGDAYNHQCIYAFGIV